MSRSRSVAMAIALGVGLLPGLSQANEFKPQIEALLDSGVRPWLSDPVLIDAIKAQNADHADITQSEIDALDQQWRAEADAGSGPLLDSVMDNDLSAFLVEKKQGLDGTASEIFVMDDVGLNVGQSDITSDYWQGDEAKWQQTYQAGPDATFIDDVEFDDSAEAFLSQASITIVDPETGAPIGAITIGLNVEKLF
ncbi:hypothetical protein [Roseospira navarrensis]|uniref:Uncharacterized protein n=1 Tax=Roseospira navarrensis TaxID=140058 RepID=A0A7X1ZBC0_9PROT|nr:hypothetical protein [Roseospira navarrensis]MQX35405.1 hypothetical protein [Roseospira navarrensis]